MRKQAALRLLLALAIGSALGLAANAFAGEAQWLELCVRYVAEPVGKVFIRLLLMLVIPIMFSALVMGIGELELHQLGRLGIRTLAYTTLVSSVAVLLGVTLVNVLEPGHGLPRELLGTARSAVEAAPLPKSTSAIDLLIGVVPNNPVAAAATGDMLAWLFFSIFFGVGLALTQGPKVDALRQIIGGLFDVCMKLMDLVLKLAPLGVGALMFSMTARVGLSVLVQLGAYVGVVVVGLGFHLFVVYGAAVQWFGRRSAIGFFRDIRLALVTAFSTASSNATLPTALRVAEENLRLPTHVSRFVLTAGATMNQNGTALFEGVTVLFLAQAYGVELDLTQQAIVMLICILAGVGTAGVPAGSLPVIAMILTLLGVPAEAIGLVLGVDRLLDMCRTTVNVAGDLVVASLVAKGESAVDRAEGPSDDAPETGA